MAFRIQPGVLDSNGKALHRTFENIKQVFRALHPDGIQTVFDTFVNVSSSQTVDGVLGQISEDIVSANISVLHACASQIDGNFIIELLGWPDGSAIAALTTTLDVDIDGNIETVAAGPVAVDLTGIQFLQFQYVGQANPGQSSPATITSWISVEDSKFE